MPRIRTSTSDPLDFCSRHFPGEASAWNRYGDEGDGPDDRGNCFVYDDEHPEYDGTYRCARCKVVLSERQDGGEQNGGSGTFPPVDPSH